MSGENKGAVPGAIHEADTEEIRRPGVTTLGQTCVERCPDYPRCSHASAPLPDRGVHAPCSPDTACQACARRDPEELRRDRFAWLNPGVADPTITADNALRGAPVDPPGVIAAEARVCTCLGSCKGAAGLAPGWRCALDAMFATAPAIRLLGAEVSRIVHGVPRAPTTAVKADGIERCGCAESRHLHAALWELQTWARNRLLNAGPSAGGDDEKWIDEFTTAALKLEPLP